MTTVDIPVVDEPYALARIDALVAEHGLPQPKSIRYNPDWTNGDAELKRICPDVDPAVLHVTCVARTQVAAWATVLGVATRTEHTIHEYADDGYRWCAVWAEMTQVRGWLPGVKLSVVHTEDRWIDAPGKRATRLAETEAAIAECGGDDPDGTEQLIAQREIWEEFARQLAVSR